MPKIINPANGEELYSYEYISKEELQEKISKASKAFELWKNTSFKQRKELFLKLASLMQERKDELALLNVREMGMLLSNGYADVAKTSSGIEYVANKAEEWLKSEEFSEGGLEGKISYEPLGILYTISPWNFPYNQVFRNACPNIMAGNVVLSKHASNVVGPARAIEKLFLDAGFPQGIYQNIEIASSFSQDIISNPLIRGVNLTGGEKAGRAVGALAGKYLKPSVLELGGNDPFILLDTNNLDETVKTAAGARLSCSGQKCNSSKRFIILEKYYDEFCEKLAKEFEAKKVGDPMLPETQVGPLAQESALDTLDNLVGETIKAGAKLLTGGKRLDMKGYFYAPTVVCDVKPGMSLFDEEAFGPVASVIKAKDIDDAIDLANRSRFGLTAGVFTDNKDNFDYVSSKLESGSVFWNKVPTSYPFLPYGGVKDSGYGRELGETGIKNFTNQKVIVY